jgi:hypothetical protein
MHSPLARFEISFHAPPDLPFAAPKGTPFSDLFDEVRNNLHGITVHARLIAITLNRQQKRDAG